MTPLPVRSPCPLSPRGERAQASSACADSPRPWLTRIPERPTRPWLPDQPHDFTVYTANGMHFSAALHRSGLDVERMRDGRYRVGEGIGDTLAEACLDCLRYLTRPMLDAADEVAASRDIQPIRLLKSYVHALADVLEVALHQPPEG